ncbi:hypothetical protein SAMN05660642_02562 [Geodermatophilus siccatus]|uniref:Uncharacterized protein n=1 Tax=Geodermatophilus siccatus TaxID=1137991 RepID=A0A1G9TLT8_9ACTN|nr:hypothetical protein [Geodermatophilus siccatus]SDM48707.1 hypothetical protein SAMN05660642_02562 [Geodermatophilus siccatus]
MPETPAAAVRRYRAVRLLVGWAAIGSSTLYVASDVLELAAGGLFTAQLVVTYLAEAAIPFVLLGLHSVQHREGGWLSLAGAVLYGGAFVGFSATVLHPLITGVRDADEVFAAFGANYDAHAVLALVGGLAFGVAVVRAAVFPRWTGIALIAGLLVTTALVAAGLSEAWQTTGTAVRSLAFAGMGVACVRAAGRPDVTPPAGPDPATSAGGSRPPGRVVPPKA